MQISAGLAGIFVFFLRKNQIIMLPANKANQAAQGITC
jgi:hypothetical protein